MLMKKIFTLIAMAFVAISVNAQEHEAGNYAAKNIVWKDITWKNGNNKKDKDDNDLLYLMGTGNGYATLFVKYSFSEDKGEWQTTPDYSYIDYENGEIGLPAYGLYYKFTPKVSGSLRVGVWVNKGGDNRKVFVVKASDGKPLTPFVDYTFDGYINGKNQEETSIPLYYNATEFKAWRDEQFGEGVQPYRLSTGGAATWGWITLNVEAGDSYCIYQQSSQLGFGGYEFTPTGGTAETYPACYKEQVGEETKIKIAAEFAAVVVDETGKATNVTDKGSVVTFSTANMDVEAVGGAEPQSVEADFDHPISTGIEDIKADAIGNTNATVYNLSGQKVDKSYKGIVIQNGRKFMNK